MSVSNKLGLEFNLDKWQKLNEKMLIKIDRKLGLRPDWGEW
jgi:hypothetical protein